MKTVSMSGGKIIVSETVAADEKGNAGQNRWDFLNPDQAEKHLPTFAEHQAQDIGDGGLAPGDISAIKDANADYQRKLARDKKNGLL